MDLPSRRTVRIRRNTKVIDIYKELQEYGITPVVVDPAADADEAKRLYGITFNTMDDVKNMDAVVVAVAHNSSFPWIRRRSAASLIRHIRRRYSVISRESMTEKNI